MSYTVEHLSGEPILLITGMPDFEVAEGSQMVKEMRSTLDAAHEKLYVVLDMSRITISLDDMMQSADMVTYTARGLGVHPKILESVVVTTSVFVRLAVKGLTSSVFGQMQTRQVESLEEALAHCRTQASTF
jgi:hypothetical protein